MRLINTRTLLFEEFTRDIPQYAILSHTWEEGEEVSFAEMGDPACTRKRGYEKVAMTCKLAAESGIGYAWVDTCCIDKSSSAELSEAINSMFRWYQRSAVCYVFLSDLNAEVALHDALVQCRWITRGWTLQELIAPKDIIFFDKTWVQRGHKVDYLDVLQSATGIDIAVLKNTVSLSRLSVAQKMSWAAHRETTRTEDRAYSLLGIFDVHMPLLYGEEERAFRRLQEEIIKTTPDVTIFGWTRPLPLASQRAALPSSPYCGILAESPEEFASSASLKPFKGRSDTDFSVTNRGIKWVS
ncbi:HET-domain-containing protein [Pleurostoma richardsiae]|uniref:HET-domain-containing protein n=1 Tax=Pleurostoma richardsiae TaxID=41990 RepID=A0AA38VSB1_9PEZI|nr:HET-domain-containing protein [Pleurostoma richardsiae]